MSRFRIFINNIKDIYSLVELIFLFAALYALSFGYFYLISKNNTVSIIFGIVGLLFFFYVYSYQSKKLNRYQEQLSSLLKYVTNMKFFLQTGENVMYSLNSTLPTLTDLSIQKDVEKVVKGLEREAILQIEHFSKYKFPSLDQFHQNLIISYEHGGDPQELFDSVQKNMMFELDKRDELYKKRKSFAKNVYVLLGLVALIPILLRFMVADLWDIFLSYTIVSLAVLLITQAAILLLLYFTQKKKLDISVRV